MATINSIDVIDRHNRPGVLQKVMLRTFFVNSGDYVDPYEISAVTVHTRASNSNPSSILTSANVVSALPLMGFGVSDTTDITGPAFATSNYSPGTTASGIFRLARGEYAVVLDGSLALSGQDVNGSTIGNDASTAGTYIDVWTVKLTAGSPYQVFINTFELFNDTFMSVTEPLLLTASIRLGNKYITLGSKEDLRIGTDITIANKGIASEVKNIFKDAAITSAMVQIRKLNEGDDLAPYTVSGYADTSSTVKISADNTVTFLWDTGLLNSIASNSSGAMGNSVGNYGVRLKFNVLNQTVVSPEMPVIVTL